MAPKSMIQGVLKLSLELKSSEVDPVLIPESEHEALIPCN